MSSFAFVPTNTSSFISARGQSLASTHHIAPRLPSSVSSKHSLHNAASPRMSLFSTSTVQQSWTSFRTLFQRSDVVDIPQNDTENAAARKESVRKACENYIWDHKAIEGASMMKGIPKGEEPAFGWIEDLIPILVRVGINTAINSSEETAEDSDSLASRVFEAAGKLLGAITTGTFGPNVANETFESVADIARPKTKATGATIEEHKELFENIQLDVVTKGNQFLRDDIFGWYRVAGPNPMRLTLCPSAEFASEMFPELDDTIVRGIRGFIGDSLQEMHDEDRLYYVSYPEFDGVPTGKDQSGKLKPNFLYSPTCLLAVPKQQVSDRVTVLPLAIRCGQDASKYPMFTANASHTDDITWLAAKCTVQVADAVIHETVYHLARTHLLVGIFICATHRTLPSSHPVFRILKCHSYGTCNINYSATTKLINPGGTIDEITAPDIFVTRGVSASGINGKEAKFNDWFIDIDLVRRGVTDRVLRYPYRDDALELWNITLKWVRSYISAYYKSDNDVTDDFELEAWCKELCDESRGNLHGFGDNGDGVVRTVEYLSRAVAHVIFSATVQHAALNFTQGTMMQFAPAMPLAGWAPAPTTDRPFESLDDFSQKMFPTLKAAEKQLVTAELIGVLQYTTFGEYGRSLEFAPEEVAEALRTFQTELGVLGGKIQQRNLKEQAVGLPVYNYLVPKNIPNSINV